LQDDARPREKGGQSVIIPAGLCSAAAREDSSAQAFARIEQKMDERLQ
jgi:hypothetical protein